MTFVYQFDPEELDYKSEDDYSPFTKIMDILEPEYNILKTPKGYPEKFNFDNFHEEYSCRVINSFNTFKKAKLSENDLCSSHNGGENENDLTNLNSAGDHPLVEETRKDSKPEHSQLSRVAPKSMKKRDQKQKKSSKPTKRRKRKTIVVKRDQYRKRKDVLMKGLLRKFRKYFQEKYTNFARVQVLQNSSEPGVDQNGLSDSAIDEGIPEVTLESLELF